MKHPKAFIYGFTSELEKAASLGLLAKVPAATSWAKGLLTGGKAVGVAKTMAPTLAMSMTAPKGGMPKTPKSVQSTSGQAYQAPGSP